MSSGSIPALAPAAIHVTDAAQAAAVDAAAIAAGIPSRALMQRAGAAAASELASRYRERLHGGVALYAGTGNNGGDAWVVAAALHAAGVPVHVRALGDPRTSDAAAERAHAIACGVSHDLLGSNDAQGALWRAIVVDGVLGTGARGEPRGAAADAIAEMIQMRMRGAAVIALDVPSGLDASDGRAEGAIVADLTLTFGTLKRGLLVARANAGRILVLDIGLGAHVMSEAAVAAPTLVTDARVSRWLPRFTATAHKGDRRRLVIVGGAAGMAGACILAARSALRSGVGMVRLLVAPESMGAVQAAVPEAMAEPWSIDASELDAHVVRWAHALVIGPGLGRSREARELADRLLDATPAPVVLDADGLNMFEGDPDRLSRALAGRPALLTPHVAEFARLAGTTVDEVMSRRFDAGLELAARTGATVLLKGVPTLLSAPGGERVVVATGTPALGTAGSGDVLSGICGTLLAQMARMPQPAATETGDTHAAALRAGACAAWVHGRAAELASVSAVDPVRGVTLERVLGHLDDAWPQHEARQGAQLPRVLPPALAELPAVRA